MDKFEETNRQQSTNRLKEIVLGRILYNPLDRYVGRSIDLYGEYSNEEANLFRNLLKPGAIVLYIGAHIGAHSLVFTDSVGPTGAVLAFEPQRLLFQMLCANMALNNHVNAYCYHAAVGAGPGEIFIPVLDYTIENNFAGLGLGEYDQGEKVCLVTIDGMDLQQCDFIKIDVESLELEVLKGAQKTIQRFRPALYIENDREEKSAYLIHHLKSIGYDLYWHRPPLFNPHNFEGNRENIFKGIVSINMLGFHRTLRAEVSGLEPVI